MDLSKFAELFPEKMKKIQEFVEGDDVKDIIGTEAVSHYKESFANEGFTDETLEKWDDVERRDKDSEWYGHSGQTGKFSAARTTAKILTGETSELRESITYEKTATGSKITSDKEYSGVHQFGKKAKVYGKKEFTMKARPYMGKSKKMKANTEKKIKKEIIKIIKQ